MERLNQEQGAAPDRSGAHLLLAAFGKHPGWDDHLPGIGVQTEGLAHAKQVFYVSGIGSQIDSGAWEKLESEKRMPGFKHCFLWSRGVASIAGRLWSSTDGRGRSKYPMVVCTESMDLSPGAVLAAAGAELDKLQAICQQVKTADEVAQACRACQAVLDQAAAPASDPGPGPASAGSKESFLNRSELGPDRRGLLRVLHEIERGMEASDAGMAPCHLRVPLCSETQANGQLLWLEFLRCVVPTDLPILLISRADTGFLDVVLGDPGRGELFCLQAAPTALPLATEIPYEIEPHLNERLGQITAVFLGDKSKARAGVGQPGASSRPASESSDAVGQVAGKERGWGKWIGFGLAAVLLIVVVLAVLFRDHDEAPPKKPPVAPVESSAAVAPALSSNVNQVVQQEEDDFQLAIEGARTALAENDSEHAIQMAERALVLKPNNAAATTLKTEAEDQREDQARRAELEQEYQAAMNDGQSAMDEKRWDEAIRQADLALSRKPGDAAATRIKADAESEQGKVLAAAERQSSYEAAVTAAREALGRGQWQPALDQSEVALSLKSDDPAALELKTDAEEQLAKAAAAAESAARYQAAMAAAEDAFGKAQWQGTVDQAIVALGQRPGDEAATQLKGDAEARIVETADLREAGARFQNGDYAGAITLCNKHASRDAFQSLRAKVEEEQSLLKGTQQKLEVADYSFIDELKGESVAGKAPFQKLLDDGMAEQRALSNLEELRAQERWEEVLAAAGSLGKATLGKPPFAALLDWAQPYADRERGTEKLSSLDANLQKLMVWFKILKPSDPLVTSEAARAAKPLPPKSLSLDQRKKYLDYLSRLEGEYEAGNWLDKDGRRDHISELKDAIPSW